MSKISNLDRIDEALCDFAFRAGGREVPNMTNMIPSDCRAYFRAGYAAGREDAAKVVERSLAMAGSWSERLVGIAARIREGGEGV